jgi:hypothetical protein
MAESPATATNQSPETARAVSIARGVSLWVLLTATILGSSWLIQRYFGEDVLRVYTNLSDRLESVDVLLAQGSPAQVGQAVHTIKGILLDNGKLLEPINVDAVLQLEQAWAAALDGTAAKIEIRDLLLKVQERLEALVKSDASDADSRFLLARLYRYSPPTSEDYSRIDPLLNEARILLEPRADRDREAGFLMARVLLTQKTADAAANARAFELVRRSGRREAELRLRSSAKLPIDVMLRRARQAVEFNLPGEAESQARHVLAVEPTNVEARMILAETAILRRPDYDARADGDEEIIAGLKQALRGEGASPRAEMYVAALEALGGSPEIEHARSHYEAAKKAGFDLRAEFAALFFAEQYGAIRLLLTAEIMLGPADGPPAAWARFARAEVTAQERKDRHPLPEAVQKFLTEALPKLQKPELGRAYVYLSLFEDNADAARKLYAQAVESGLDLHAEIERFGKLKPFGVVRRLLEAATREPTGFGLTGDAVNDSELFYQFGRATALGVDLFDPDVSRMYRRAVEIGRGRKTAGAGKAAFSLARIVAGGSAKEARELLDLARDCGIVKMDITTREQILERINSAEAARAEAGKAGRKVESH